MVSQYVTPLATPELLDIYIYIYITQRQAKSNSRIVKNSQIARRFSPSPFHQNAAAASSPMKAAAGKPPCAPSASAAPCRRKEEK